MRNSVLCAYHYSPRIYIFWRNFRHFYEHVACRVKTPSRTLLEDGWTLFVAFSLYLGEYLNFPFYLIYILFALWGGDLLLRWHMHCYICMGYIYGIYNIYIGIYIYIYICRTMKTRVQRSRKVSWRYLITLKRFYRVTSREVIIYLFSLEVREVWGKSLWCSKRLCIKKTSEFIHIRNSVYTLRYVDVLYMCVQNILSLIKYF